MGVHLYDFLELTEFGLGVFLVTTEDFPKISTNVPRFSLHLTSYRISEITT